MKLSHYLFASEHNDYKPWIITAPALAVFCLIVWGLRLFVPAGITVAAPNIDPTDLMKRINSERTQRFIPALSTNALLITAAAGKANDMIARSYFAHVDPDGNYVWPRIEAANYKPYLTLGENLAMDFTSADGVVSAWMNSPTHRENILNGKFEDQGLNSVYGTFETNHDTIMVVSLFGTLYKTIKASPPPAPITKKTTPPSSPAPSPVSAPQPPQGSAGINLGISKDIKISNNATDHSVSINIDVIIFGAPALATARLKSQSITLAMGKTSGEYLGTFTFDPSENLTSQTLTVEAQDKNSHKVSQDFPLNLDAISAATPQTPMIPITSEAQIIKILRVIFGIFAAVYMLFLVIDAIIIHRAKIKRAGIHSNPHVLIFFLIAAVTLFAKWF